MCSYCAQDRLCVLHDIGCDAHLGIIIVLLGFKHVAHIVKMCGPPQDNNEEQITATGSRSKVI